MIATNGRGMAILRRRDMEIPESFIFPTDILKLIPSKFKELKIDFDSKTKMITAKPIGAGWASPEYRFNAIEGDFPKWRQVVPEKVGAGHLKVNGEYMNEFAMITKVLMASKEFGIVVAASDDGLGPIIIQNGCEDFLGILMPLRLDRVAALPTWIKK